MRKTILPVLAILLVLMACNTPVEVKLPPTATLAATITSAFTATPTLPPTATPTPTPPPAVRVEIAEKLLFVGNYEQARREFQSVQAGASDPELKLAATLGLGRSLFLQNNYSNAATVLEGMVMEDPNNPQQAAAYYFLARTYEQQDAYDKAAEAYAKYLSLRPGVLDAYIQELRGDALINAGNPSAAINAYGAAAESPQIGTTTWIELKLGRAYAAAGDFSSAIQKYLEIYESSNNDYARAQANYLMGQAYLTMGMPEQAYARFLDSVALFPRAYDTYSGLVQLVSANVPVNELQRGIVDYYAGQYGLAIEALGRYIDSNTEVEASAHHFLALSRLAMNQPERAIANWDYLIENYPGDALWPTAWEEKAYVLWAYMDRHDEAAQVLLNYVDKAPESSRSPEFLYQAARILERGKRLQDAAAAWERLIDQYPAAEQSYRGLFLAGISYYRSGALDEALTVFQRLLVLSTTPDEQAAAHLWIGKTQQARGDTGAARSAWQQGAAADPTGYYSERANELLQNRTPFSINQPVDLGYDLDRERPQAEQWLRSTFALPAETDLNGLGPLASDSRITRAAAFWELGLYSNARNELEDLRSEVASDPTNTYRLMNYMLDLGVYRSAILASRQILDLAGMSDIDTLQAPAYFNHIRFGVYFTDLVLDASHAEEIHPLLLLSVMRQESLFESFAISSASARGLMQIMPATGAEIAGNMSWPANFTEADLYRPEVSVRMGARYLARQRDYFNGSIHAALAAYNGGPGNTIIWNELSQNDPDLLLEVIRADETRKYITQIYEFFNIYRLLYERGS